MRSILESHSVSTLKKEISKTNIKGYSKMKKDEIVNLMLQHKDRFSHIKLKEKAEPKAKPKKEEPKPKKEEPKPKKEEPKKKKLVKKGQNEKVSGFLADIESKGKKVADKVNATKGKKAPEKFNPRFLGDVDQGDKADEWWEKNEDKPKWKKMYNKNIDVALMEKGYDPEKFKNFAYQFSKEGRARYEEASEIADEVMRKYINKYILGKGR